MSEFLQQSPRRAGNLCEGLLMASTLLFCIPCHAETAETDEALRMAETAACLTAASAAEAPWTAVVKTAVQNGNREAGVHAACMDTRESVLACLRATHEDAEMIRRESLILQCP